MTAKTRNALVWAAQWAALLVPAIGGAWSIAKAVGATKLDVVRFERDSIARDSRDRLYDAHQITRDTILANLDRRTREMYCAGKPPGCR